MTKLEYLIDRYWKPKSISWLASFITFAAGMLVASEPLHGMTPLVQSIDNVTGGVAPALLINAGLVGIGLRGAME